MNWKDSLMRKGTVWSHNGKAPVRNWLGCWVHSTIIIDRFLCLDSTVPSTTSTWSNLNSFLGCDETLTRIKIMTVKTLVKSASSRRGRRTHRSEHAASNFSISATTWLVGCPIRPSSKPTKFRKPNLIFLTNGLITPPNWMFLLCLLTTPSIRNWNRRTYSKWETKRMMTMSTMAMSMTRMTKYSVQGDIVSYMTYGEIEAWPHFAIFWSITTIWTSVLLYKQWKKCKNSISILTSTCSRWPSPFRASLVNGYSRLHTMPKPTLVWYNLKTTISTTPSSRTSSGVPASYSPEMPRWDALSCGTIPLVPASISSDWMQMRSTSTVSTKPCHAEGMSNEVLRISSQTLDSLVKTCCIGWIISWKRRGSISSMHAITSVKFESALISWNVTTPTRGPCMNSTDVTFTDALIARNIKTSWVKSGKCTPSPKKNTSETRVIFWRSFGNMNSSPCRDQSPNWKSSFDNVNPLLSQTSLDHQRIHHPRCCVGW